MSLPELTNTIINNLKLLPYEKIEEVNDFIDFIISKKKNTKEVNISETVISKEDAIELRNRFSTFEKDWNVTGMEKYDEL